MPGNKALLAKLLIDSHEEELAGDPQGVSTQKAKTPKSKTASKKKATSKKEQSPAKRRVLSPRARLFAELLPEYDYKRIEAYMAAFPETTKRNSAGANSKRLMADPLFWEYFKSTTQPMLEDIESDKAFIAQQIYNLARSDITSYFDFIEYMEPIMDDGEVVAEKPIRTLALRDITAMPEWQRQNIKKIKIHATPLGQDIEMELYDRSAFVHRLAQALKVYEGVGDVSDRKAMLSKFEKGESRARDAADKERQRRITSGEYKDIDGILVKNEG